MASLSPANASTPAPDAAAIAPQHFDPPTLRELRGQALHRLQIGILGLAAMLLLIGLANIIMDRARVSDAAEARSAPEATVATMPSSPVETPASDPLADIGVVPEMPNEQPLDPVIASPAAAASGQAGTR